MHLLDPSRLLRTVAWRLFFALVLCLTIGMQTKLAAHAVGHVAEWVQDMHSGDDDGEICVSCLSLASAGNAPLPPATDQAPAPPQEAEAPLDLFIHREPGAFRPLLFQSRAPPNLRS